MEDQKQNIKRVNKEKEINRKEASQGPVSVTGGKILYKLTDDQVRLLKGGNFSVVYEPDDEIEYINFPYWLKKAKGDKYWEVVRERDVAFIMEDEERRYKKLFKNTEEPSKH